MKSNPRTSAFIRVLIESEEPSMRIPIDPQSTIPLYRQIEEYLREQILTGQLEPETRLPASRQLAQELGLSRITVNNAYATLESEGLLYSREGSGTYVLDRRLQPAPAPTAGGSWPLWQQALSQTTPTPDESRHAQPLRGQPHPQPIAFTGVGDPREFPLKAFARTMQDVLQRDGTAALLYGEIGQGYAPLRTTLSHVLASQGITAPADQILITSGSQQALAFVCQLLVRPGDVILVENPTYNVALQLFAALNLQVVGVPVDGEGMRVELVEALLQQHHPKLIYTIPNFQNPTGMSLSAARRRQLVALADRYNIPLLEDDFVGDLRYEGRTQAALKTLDPGGRVIHIGTFSKMLMPGLRIGYLIAEGPVLERLVALKIASDLSTAPLMQRTLEAYVSVGNYQRHLRRSCRLYRQRRDAMLTAVRHHLPAVHVDPPQGGLFVWLRLPEGASSVDLLARGRVAGVEFAPGTRFFVKPSDGERYLRLNFATRTPTEITEGVRRLGSIM